MPETPEVGLVESRQAAQAEAHSAKLIRKLLWHGIGVFDWVWLVARLSFVETDRWFGWAHQVPIWAVALLTIVALASHLALQTSKVFGCFVLCLFPLYLALLPIALPSMLLIRTWTATTELVKRSQKVLFSLGNYALTAASIGVLLVGSEQPALVRASVVLAVVSLLLVTTSATTWLFDPFSWFCAVMEWPTRFVLWLQERLSRADEEAFYASPSAGASKLKSFLESIASAKKSLAGPVTFSPDDADVLLVVGFARKFLVSLLHAAFLFAVVARALAVLSMPSSPPFSNFVAPEFSSDWLSLFFYSLTTMVSGETGVLPLNDSARIWVLTAKLTSVGFLVILVATFSILSREKARMTAERLRSTRQRALARLEQRALRIARLAQEKRALDEKSLAVLLGMGDPTALPEAEMEEWRGIIRVEQALSSLGPTLNGVQATDLERYIQLLDEVGWGEFRREVLENGGVPARLFSGPTMMPSPRAEVS